LFERGTRQLWASKYPAEEWSSQLLLTSKFGPVRDGDAFVSRRTCHAIDGSSFKQFLGRETLNAEQQAKAGKFIPRGNSVK